MTGNLSPLVPLITRCRGRAYIPTVALNWSGGIVSAVQEVALELDSIHLIVGTIPVRVASSRSRLFLTSPHRSAD